MPDNNHDLAAAMRERGAEPVTLRFRPDGASTAQRHAAYRLPPDHPEMHRLDQLHAARHLDARLYTNACAVWHLWQASGLGKSEGIATWLRTCRTSGAGDADRTTAEDELRYLIRNAVDFEAVLMLVRGDSMGNDDTSTALLFGRAKRGLDKLDALAARWDGEMWRDE
jgi:hypothetical protein